MEFKSESEKQTMQFAKQLARQIKAPCIILLKGDLGAGKTHFVKGFAQGMKARAQVTSPTFTIMNIYQGKVPIYHFDLYRIGSDEEAEQLGFFDYFDHDSLDGVSIVEWPENAPGLVQNYDIEITIEKLNDENSRLIKLRRRD